MIEKLRSWIKRDINIGNKLLLYLLVGGYVFFITSKIWMPDSGELIEATPYYEVQVMAEHEVYLTRWDYSEKDQAMEVIVEIQTKDLLDKGLGYEAVERTKGKLEIQAVRETADYMVFRITGIPDGWKEISLRLTEEGGDLLRLYTNIDAVERTESLPEKDQDGYEADRLEAQISYDQFQIQEQESVIQDLKEENIELEQRITELENAVYPTEEEAEAAGDTVTKARDTISANEADIEEREGGLRKHQKTEDERFLYWCDKKGLLVWSEMAAAYEFEDYGVEEFTREWTEIVRQNYSHPCIIIWTPFNESWGIPQVKTDPRQQHFTEEIYHLTKTLDPYRPVIVNDGWEHTVSDIITLHDYEEEGKILLDRYLNCKEEILKGEVYHCSSKSAFAQGYGYKGQPVIISEYGGIAFAGEDKRWGYGNKVADKEAFIQRFDEITTAVKSLPYVCGYCYTQVSDVQQEINGLMDARRNFKVDPEVIREINERKVGYWRSFM